VLRTLVVLSCAAIREAQSGIWPVTMSMFSTTRAARRPAGVLSLLFNP
jgi:hypothetical protein